MNADTSVAICYNGEIDGFSCSHLYLQLLYVVLRLILAINSWVDEGSSFVEYKSAFPALQESALLSKFDDL